MGLCGHRNCTLGEALVWWLVVEVVVAVVAVAGGPWRGGALEMAVVI